MANQVSKFLIGTVLLLIPSCSAFAQSMELSLGKVSPADLQMKNYPRDTSASAVMLNELGQGYISDRPDEDLIFERYMKIKILKRRGFDQANFELRLGKTERKKESLLSVVAITYNLENGARKESKMNAKMVFTEDDGKYSTLVKFTLPDIREGSVLEVLYRLNSPFIQNFRPWEFQSAIPKVHSEYWPSIPGNYLYNISLRGFYGLSKNESTEIKDCYQPGGGNKANCILYKYAMDDVPAFVEEDYMTAESNFISAVHFELTETRDFNGAINKYAKTWKDVDQELRQNDYFGVQIRKAQSIFEDKVKENTRGETDELKKAVLVYTYIKDNYTWNGYRGYHTENGVKKAFETRKGNAGDINLTLVGALQAAGLNASPVILSTRANGTPLEIFPVMTEFDYVIGSVDIGGKRYLLDATNALQPFGFIPMRCLNGKGRLMAKESSWTELKPKDKKKTLRTISLSMTSGGVFKGQVAIHYQGYAAFSKRQEILEAGGLTGYQKLLQSQMKEMEMTNYTLMNLDSLENPLIEKMDIKLSTVSGASTIYFNPFLFGRIEQNPFKSSERLYPVDFGAPMEDISTLTLQNLGAYTVEETPSQVALSLPNAGGKYFFSVSTLGDKVSITSSLSINRAVYNSTEYHYLKELYGRIVQTNQSQIVLKLK